jgi:signal transduction histidine kinase
MNASAFAKTFLVKSGLVTLASYGCLALFAPLVLGLEREHAVDVLVRVAVLALVGSVASVVVAWPLARELRFVLRALAIGSATLEATDIDLLRRLPLRALTRYLALGLVSAAALSLFPPERLGGELGRELGLLTIATFSSAAIPALVLHQSAISALLEAAPLDPVLACLEELEQRGLAHRRARRALILAVTLPVLLVGVGGVLACRAHLRALIEERRLQTAYAIGRGVLGPSERPVAAARRRAAEAAAARGYLVELRPPGEESPPVRQRDDRIGVTVAIEGASASIGFAAGLPRSSSIPFALAGASMAALAIALASLLARVLARDVSTAVARLRALGTETVLRGDGDDAPRARLEEVAELGRAVGKLAGRFRVFAQAQERALESRENARRARGLLFASVSHDLRSPLNAILGFAESIDPAPLSPGQRESLDVISTRGRELVALIETILDAARVEAGQLRLERRPTSAHELLEATRLRSSEIAGVEREARFELSGALPSVEVDLAQTSKALAVVVAHAVRSLGADDASRSVLVRASATDDATQLRVEVTPAAVELDAEELRALFARRETGRARGLALGLSLARVIVELHGGRIVVESRGDGLPAVVVLLPVRSATSGPRRDAGPA